MWCPEINNKILEYDKRNEVLKGIFSSRVYLKAVSPKYYNMMRLAHTKSTISQNTNIFPTLLGKYLPFLFLYLCSSVRINFPEILHAAIDYNFFHSHNCRN
jgi:hypothetical protein